MSPMRVAVPAIFLVVALLASVFAALAADVTWQSVGIGVASTFAAAGLVDLSALYELRRRERAILRIAGQRVGLIHQRLLWVLQALFGVSGEAATYSAQLRSLTRFEFDLTLQDPVVTPPRSKAASVASYVAEMDTALDATLSLGTQTSEAARFERLDRALRSGVFSIFMRASPASPRASGVAEYPAAAAAVLDVVQREFRFFCVDGRRKLEGRSSSLITTWTGGVYWRGRPHRHRVERSTPRSHASLRSHG